MIIDQLNFIQNEGLLQTHIFPFLIDLQNENETASLKRVCKIWNNLLTNISKTNYHRNQFIIQNMHLFNECKRLVDDYEKGILIRIYRRPRYLNTKIFQAAVRVLDSLEDKIIPRAYQNRLNTIDLTAVDKVASYTIEGLGFVTISYLLLKTFDKIALIHASEDLESNGESLTPTLLIGVAIGCTALFLEMLIVPQIAQGRFPQIRPPFRSLLSLDASIKLQDKLIQRKSGYGSLNCAQKAIQRLKGFFSAIWNSLR